MSDKHNFKREVKFQPAFDRRHSEPGKNYGIHGVELCFYLTGDKGAVQFIVYTNWHLPSIDLTGWSDSMKKPLPADVGCHSPKRLYKNQYSVKECRLLAGKTCYYDGSTLAANDAFDILVAEGSDGVWKFLEDYYEETFFPVDEKMIE